MVTYGGEQSLERYLALSARGVPFNIAHAVGNSAFALAAGPAFVRMPRPASAPAWSSNGATRRSRARRGPSALRASPAS